MSDSFDGGRDLIYLRHILEQVWMAIEHELPALKIEVGRLLRGLFD
jgi:hypothetical protein